VADEKSADGATKKPDEESAQLVRFDHKFFKSFEDLYFRLTDANEPAVVVTLSKNNEAVLLFDGIRKEFGIAKDSADDIMLKKVAESLEYVTLVRLGDALPSEVATGEPSWEPSERHFLIAQQRLTLQLVSWMTGDEHVVTSVEQLMMIANDPQTKKNINLAFGEAAEELGLGRDHRDEVIKQIEILANELAYIEAMRDIYGEIIKIDEKLQGLRSLFGADRSMLDTADQVARLSQRCLQKYRDVFDTIDAQTGEVMAMLRNITNQLEYIRTTRNDLYKRLHPWEEFIRKWKSVYVVKSEENVMRIREIYQFLAPRFMKVNDWVLMSKRGMDKTKPLGGVLRW
jgi:hypothetical protein